ncbi:MAG: tRNA (adenosine(37)-N6)-dimethylallyltransferase MiaA [Propionibacteriaceae bacterium]|nr:tRNA (adenosine(37)-N6)-dimethylallyltransferase MiaA [Propionibacteriaceae bacterium]
MDAVYEVLVLAGATATGKSRLAIDLAEALAETGQPAEIVNADSMLVYRGMDIGTAKPSLADRRRVPHHLIDIMDIDQSASVAAFQGMARDIIADCRRRQVLPIVVGGSALYLHAIVDDVTFPATDETVRGRLTQELSLLGADHMHERLRSLSPDAADAIDPTDSRRIVRALEAIELTGEFRASLPTWTYALDSVLHIGLTVDRATMDARIETRVAAMWAEGFVEEVRALEARGLREARTASRAIGYRQILDHLDGVTTEDEAREWTVIRTRQFSRKQLTWWRRDPRIQWLPADVDTADVLRLLG